MPANKFFVICLKVLAGTALLVFLAVYFLQPIELDDIWWHLKSGQYIAQTYSLPHFDPFAFADEKTPWIFTSWLGSLLLFCVYQASGLEGLIAFRIIVFLLTLGVFLGYGYRKIPFPLLISLIFIMGFGLELRKFLRPDMFNYVFLQVLLILLFKYEQNKDRKYLFALPVLGMIWSNIHLGSFVYGGLTLAVFIFSNLIKYLGEKHSQNGVSPQARESLKQAKEVFVGLVAYLAAFVLSPYGLENFIYPWQVFLMPKFIHFHASLAMTSENRPPTELLLSFSGIWFYILLLVGAAVLAVNKERPLFHILIFCVALFMFIYGIRAGAFFTLIAGYVILENLSVLLKLGRWPGLASRRAQTIFCWALIFFAAINTVHALNRQVFVDGSKQKLVFLKRDPLVPAKVVQLLEESGVKGKVFNMDLYGGYLLWRSYPSLRPFVDGRRITDREWNAFYPSISSPARHWPKAEQDFQFDVVMLSANTTFTYKLMQVLMRDPSWQLVLVEEFCVVFVKKGKFGLSAKLDNYVNSLQQIKVDPKRVEEWLKKPLKKISPMGRVRDFLFPEPDFIDVFEESIALYDLGFKDAGIKGVLKALEISDTQEARRTLKMMWEKYSENYLE